MKRNKTQIPIEAVNSSSWLSECEHSFSVDILIYHQVSRAPLYSRHDSDTHPDGFISAKKLLLPTSLLRNSHFLSVCMLQSTADHTSIYGVLCLRPPPTAAKHNHQAPCLSQGQG